MPVPLGSSGQWPVKDFPGWMDRTERWLRGLDARIANVGRISTGDGGGGGAAAPVYMIASSGAAQSINNTTWTVRTGWTQDAASGGPNAGAWTITSGVATVPADGVYTIAGLLTLTAWASGTGHRALVAVLVNGTTQAFQNERTGTTVTTQHIGMPFAVSLSLSAGDTIAIQAYQTSGATQAFYPATSVHRWSMVRTGTASGSGSGGGSFNPPDTGWVNMTPATGTGICRYRVRSGWVFVQLSLSGLTGVTASTTFNIVTAANGLPANLRPEAVVRAAGWVTTAGVTGWVSANTDGSIQGFYPTVGSLAQHVLSWPAPS